MAGAMGAPWGTVRDSKGQLGTAWPVARAASEYGEEEAQGTNFFSS